MITTWDYAIREYRIDSKGESGGSMASFEEWLQEAGESGWELVSVMPVTTHSELKPNTHGYYAGASVGEHGLATTTRLAAFLKRPSMPLAG